MPARESFRSSTPPDSKCSTSAVVAQLRKIAARALPKLRVSAAAATIRVSRGALAQLVRAPPCHGGGCGFEPRRLRNPRSPDATSLQLCRRHRVAGRTTGSHAIWLGRSPWRASSYLIGSGSMRARPNVGARAQSTTARHLAQATLTSMCLDLARSFLGRCTVSNPFLNSAFTLLPSASSGRAKLRIKVP